MVNIRDYIEKRAQDIGIDIIGFTDGKPLSRIKPYLEFRIENRLITEFEEANISKRIDPKTTLPNCKSIIVIGISYNVDFKIKRGEKPVGILSKSSWGLDYHKLLKEKMEKLIEEIKKKVDFKYKAYVDTGPLIDRELAHKAGIGYYGKNCSIINKEYGSFIFLGYILTDLGIKTYSIRLESECGSCDLCIRACPTGALEGSYRLNPKKCISYLTQTREVIEEGLRGKMANKIYGCDTCQQVCPKNKGVKLSRHKEFMPNVTKGVVDLGELFSMSNREFRQKYGHMAGSWRGRNLLRRNGIINLVNMKEDLSLIEELDQENPLYKNYIDWARKKTSKANWNK
ncbi:MAG TPA: tRNA epoxyqueuosine(34) reductase QueG [Tissierellaceae bacterium]|nr:tRNA epoxyqueuosine(34) reductase QueG [Tissierellaceae bacterium]